MLPAAHRMRRAADFTLTTRSGRRLTRGPVVAYLDSAPDATAPSGPALVGLIVGRAVGGSVARHAVARRIRGAMAPLLPDLPHGSRVVIRALAGAADDRDLPARVDQAVRALLAKADRETSR